MRIINWFKQKKCIDTLYKINGVSVVFVSICSLCLMIYICIKANRLWSAIIWCSIIFICEMFIAVVLHTLFAIIISLLEWDDYNDE